jgi:hypothetical protein
MSFLLLHSLFGLCCVHVVATVVLVSVYSTPSLTSFLIEITCVRRERLQRVEIPHKRD